ncbi:MAG TPA: hypothetical protein VJ302_14740, partial [Blastocatellia bacterium]|nr:hypothetical protein [Blastocatellia bacterium]
MSDYNARISFAGLFLFCFSPRKSGFLPDHRDRCEIGILHQTELDEHEFVIRVEQEPIRGGGLVLADPARVGMSENPLTLDQVQLR